MDVAHRLVESLLAEGETLSSWFSGSKVVDSSGRPLRVYHGSNQPFKTFSASRRGASTYTTSARNGYFFTDDPDVAGEYADLAASRVVANVRDFERRRAKLKAAYDRLDAVAARTRRPEDFTAAERAMEEWESTEINARQEDTGQNVTPVYLRMVNPLVVEWDAMSGLSAQRGLAEVMKDARRSGHDGVIVTNCSDSPLSGKVSNHYVVFKNSQILPAIGVK